MDIYQLVVLFLRNMFHFIYSYFVQIT